MLNYDKLTKVLLLAGLVVLVRSLNLYGYIDPGTGSFFFQILIAGLVGASFLIKTFWGNIKKVFGKYIFGDEIEDD